MGREGGASGEEGESSAVNFLVVVLFSCSCHFHGNCTTL